MISLDGLTKRYGGKTAVDDLTFTIRPGAVTGFLGPNGAGKSTTMRMILGLDTPDRGQALIGGVPYPALNWPLRTVGALLDAGAFHPGRSGRTHLAALAASNDIPGTRVEQVLRTVGLSDAASRSPCSATRVSYCSMSRSTGWTRRASAGSGTCCAGSPPRAGRCSCRAT